MTGDTKTVTGKTLGENVDKWMITHGKDWEGQDVIRPVNNPIKKTGHIRCVLAPLSFKVPCFLPFVSSLVF